MLSGRGEHKVAMTFCGGTHDLWTRYWLAAGGIDPDKHLQTIVVPPLAWLPLSLAAFRDAQPSAIFVLLITAIWPVIINTAVGVRNVPQDYRTIARVIRLRGFGNFTRVVLPSAAAYISTGLRIGIARPLAMQPKVLLLDEPFGALDALTRARLQDQVIEIHARLGTTVLTITHDVDEAVLLSDRIVITTNGPEATIGEVLEPRLPRPRDRLALAADPRFVAARKVVMEFLYARHRNPAAEAA